jgi:hypothetical protein
MIPYVRLGGVVDDGVNGFKLAVVTLADHDFPSLLEANGA